MTMMNEHNEYLIPDYLDGLLDSESKAQFEAKLSQNNELAKELEAYKKLMEAFKTEPLVAPSKNLLAGFEKMLEEEKQNQVKVVTLNSVDKKRWFHSIPRVAASIILLIGAFIAGRFMQQNENQVQLAEVETEALEYKEAALFSLLENESASKRIRGVELIKEFEKPDEQIVAALGEKMLKDENTNVRLSALEALSSFSYSDQVKDVFIEALKSEKNPSMQVAIIEMLVQLQEKKAVEPMKRLLEEEETQPFIKDQINLALPKII